MNSVHVSLVFRYIVIHITTNCHHDANYNQTTVTKHDEVPKLLYPFEIIFKNLASLSTPVSALSFFWVKKQSPEVSVGCNHTKRGRNQIWLQVREESWRHDRIC
jgi:hypothetical protein